VAVFGSKDTRSATERLVVLAETYATEAPAQKKLRERINAVAVELTGSPVDEVVLAPPHSVLKTSSGKVRRDGTRQRYEQGLIDSRQRSVWLQFTRLAFSSLKPQWQRLRWSVQEHAYAAYAWTLFGLMAPLVWLLVAILPFPSLRWGLIRMASRLVTRLAGVKLLVHGEEHLQSAQPAIIVANHASYLDGLLLVAALPGRFHFIAKRELLSKRIPRIFLKRIGADFVERFDPKGARNDLDRLNQLAARGRSLLFFPEGTFTRMPGLLPFRMGAFVAATQNDLPVVPVTIRGSRSLLRAGSWFPRRVMVTMIISPSLRGEGKGWEATLKLRDETRAEILKWYGEPDLSGEQAMVDENGFAENNTKP
jgi:1-acyl-sn-glycerol-3-phosphate acyltransferase